MHKVLLFILISIMMSSCSQSKTEEKDLYWVDSWSINTLSWWGGDATWEIWER